MEGVSREEELPGEQKEKLGQSMVMVTSRASRTRDRLCSGLADAGAVCLVVCSL